MYPLYFANCFIGLSYAEQANVKAARLIYEAMLERANLNKGRRSAPACLAASFLSSVYYEMNELEALHELLANRLDIIDEVTVVEGLQSTYYSKARAHYAGGDIVATDSALKHLQILAEKLDLKRLLAAALAERIRFHLLTDEYQTAQNLYEQLITVVTGYSGANKGLLHGLQLTRDICGIRLQIYEGSWEAASKLIHQLQESLGQSTAAIYCLTA